MRHHPLHQRQHHGLLVAQVLGQHLAQPGEPDVEGVAVLLAGVVDDRGEPVGAGLHERVDALVLLAHRPYLGAVGLAAALLDRRHEHGPVQGVLGGVVVVQGPGEPLPPVGQRLPGVTVAERGGPHGRREGRQVAPEGVVHHVHPGVVVGALGDERLAGQVDLGAACGGGRRGRGACAHGVLLRCCGVVRPVVAARHPPWGAPLGRHLGGRRKRGTSRAGHRRRRQHTARLPEEQLPMSYDPTTTTATTTTQTTTAAPAAARPRPPPRRMACRPTPRSSSWAAPA